MCVNVNACRSDVFNDGFVWEKDIEDIAIGSSECRSDALTNWVTETLVWSRGWCLSIDTVDSQAGSVCWRFCLILHGEYRSTHLYWVMEYRSVPQIRPTFCNLSLSTKRRGGAYINVGCDNFSRDYALPPCKAWPHCQWGVGATVRGREILPTLA